MGRVVVENESVFRHRRYRATGGRRCHSHLRPNTSQFESRSGSGPMSYGHGAADRNDPPTRPARRAGKHYLSWYDLATWCYPSSHVLGSWWAVISSWLTALNARIPGIGSFLPTRFRRWSAGYDEVSLPLRKPCIDRWRSMSFRSRHVRLPRNSAKSLRTPIAREHSRCVN